MGCHITLSCKAYCRGVLGKAQKSLHWAPSPRQWGARERETPIHRSSSRISARFSRCSREDEDELGYLRPPTPHHRQHNLAEISTLGSPLHSQIRISVEWNTHTQNRPLSARNAAGSGMRALHTTESSTTPSLQRRASVRRGADKQDDLASNVSAVGTMLRIVRIFSPRNDGTLSAVDKSRSRDWSTPMQMVGHFSSTFDETAPNRGILPYLMGAGRGWPRIVSGGLGGSPLNWTGKSPLSSENGAK